MRTQWTTKEYRDAGSSCSCDRGLHRYLRNFGGGGGNPPPPRYTAAPYHRHEIWETSGPFQAC